MAYNNASQFVIAGNDEHGVMPPTAGKRTPIMPYIDRPIYENEFNYAAKNAFLADCLRIGFYIVDVKPNRQDISVSTRVTTVNNSNATLVVTFAYNADGDGTTFTSANGTEAFYSTQNPYAEQSLNLATDIYDKVIEATGSRGRGVKTLDVGMLSSVRIPAALLEAGFMTNFEEAKQMLDPDYVQAVGRASCEGVCEFLNVQYIPITEDTFSTIRYGSTGRLVRYLQFLLKIRGYSVGSVDGKIFDGGTAQGYRLELGSHSFIDNFEDQIVGMAVGDEKDVNVTFPENYQEKSLAGKKAVFKVVVQKIEKKEIPQINDEFAANVSEFENLEDYKKDIEKRLVQKLEQEKERKVENDLLEKIVKGSKVEIPDILIERQLNIFIKDFETRLSYQGIKLEEYLNYLGTSIEDLRKERREQAQETVKTRLVLEALVKKENMIVSEEELNKALLETAEKYKKSVEEYKKSLDDRTIAYYQNDILMKKLLDFLKTNNNII